MKKSVCQLIFLFTACFSINGFARETKPTTEKLLYHNILTSNDGHIIPWYSPDLGKSYDFVINQVWNFWNTMRTDKNGLPYYMNHQVWRGDFNDRRGVGGDQSMVTNAIRTLNWATYMVDNDGKNCYSRDEVWMTDGYGDYVRHYLRAMAWKPELATSDENHLLSSTSVIQLMEYAPEINKFLVPEVPVEKVKNTLIHYRTFDLKSTEIIRMTEKPESVLINNKQIPETEQSELEGWSWKPLEKGGVLTVRHWNGNNIVVMGK